MLIDFLIVGQGLAGSLLAWELMQRGCRVLVIDNGQDNASQIAAGLINPVTGMRFVKTIDIEVLLPAAIQCYGLLSTFFQKDFYIAKPMLRLFRNATEPQYALKRLHQQDYHAYLGNITTAPQHTICSAINTPLGYIEQKQTGYVLTRALLQCLRAFFIANNSYQCADFNYLDLRFSPMLHWQNHWPKKIIFCEGHQARYNPWFSWLPFQVVKGEILSLQHTLSLPDKLLNYGHWLIPLDCQNIRIGASFDRTHLNTQPTIHAKHNLLHALSLIIHDHTPMKLINHQAHIRPCTLDKKPFIGEHPQHNQLTIFNGFGAKGSLQIPHYSQLFADALLKNTPYPNAITRHYDTHFPR